MSDQSPFPVAPYKHSEWNVGEVQTPIVATLSPSTIAQIGKLVAESIEAQYPALRVCVVNIPMFPVQASVVPQGSE